MKELIVQIGVTICAVALALGHIKWPNAVDAITVSLLLAAILPWSAAIFQKLKLPGGFEVEFQVVRKKVVDLEFDVRALRVALTGIVTKHEIRILRGLVDGSFPSAHYAPDFFNELKSLDAKGFIRPANESGGRLETIRERFGDEKIPVDNRVRFQLSDFVEITPAGKEYVSLYNQADKDAQQVAPANVTCCDKNV